MPSSRWAPTRKRRKGFTLVELLVVIAIIGLTVTLGLSGILSALRRQRLSSAANEVGTLAGKAFTTMQDENQQTFLVFSKYVAGSGTDVAVVVDENENGVCDEAISNAAGLFSDAPRTRVPWRVRLPEDIALSNTALSGQVFNAQWRRPTSGAVSAVLLCDFMGRAIIPPEAVGGARAVATGPATVQLCQRDMISGELEPLVTYTVSVAPLFKVTVRRVP